MINYIFLIAAVLISVYSYTFARWLGANGNKRGMFGIIFIIVINLSLSLYRMFNAG